MARKVKLGDIVEISTARGFSYAHFSHKHPQYGALLRVFTVHLKTRPERLDVLVDEEPTFLCFFPLSAAVNRKIFPVVANTPLPERAKKFPLFRTGVVDPKTRKVSNWWLWDGTSECNVGTLTSEQRKLSIRGIWNDTLLIERIESGWTPETDPT